jgi:hypothetical protein
MVLGESAEPHLRSRIEAEPRVRLWAVMTCVAGTVVYSLAPGPKLVHEEKAKELEEIVDDTAESEGMVLKSKTHGTNAQAADGLRQRSIHTQVG